MAKSQTSITLGGKERILLFNLGALRIIAEQSGGDPLQFSGELKDLGALVKQTTLIAYGGMVAHYKKTDKKKDFTVNDVEGWVDDLDLAEAMKILNAFMNCFKAEGDAAAATGEGGKNTRRKATDVAGNA